MNLRIRLYDRLVNRIPMIQKKYHEIRQQKSGMSGRVYAWGALLGMNLAAPFCKKRWEKSYYYPDYNKKIPEGMSESALSYREAPEKFAKKLAQYDVISFDVFDTLIFRPFSKPTDLFYMVGEKLHYLDFERIRRMMEMQARQKAYKQSGSYEVTLQEIYQELQEYAGIPCETGMKAEIETELEFCVGNPYMQEVFRQLQQMGKEIICTSDMYLSENVISQMLGKCGYTGIKKCFISCEHGVSKGNGGLYQIVKTALGTEKKYVHVGDNPESDGVQAVKCGFASEIYQNVNVAGMPYRAEDMSVITGSLYRGIVNIHIHNGLQKYSPEYELGFIYGGLFAVGYCQFIHEYVKAHPVDRILFLSRDGEILKRIYDMLYPEESATGKTAYTYWSRLVATKMAAGYYKYDYFRRFIDHKVNQNYTLKQVFKSMEIEDMLSAMCAEFVRGGKTLTESTELTTQNAELIKEYLRAHWAEVLKHYDEQIRAGKLYYEKILEECKRVVAVDIGWAGSGAITLEHMIRNVWKIDCEVTGLLAGTNTTHNAEPHMSEAQLQSGKLVSYLFSGAHNREAWKWHDAAKGHNLAIELLTSASHGSFKKFVLASEDGYCLCFKQPDVAGHVVEEIQRGIMEFAWLIMPLMKSGKIQVSGEDVYGVMRMCLRKEYYKRILQKISDLQVEKMELGI